MAYSINAKDYFNTLLYSGNSTARSLTGVGFEPSFTWIKERTATSDHMLFDQPRGVQKYISSNLDSQEQTSAGMLTAFGSDGFSLGSGNDVNDNGQTYASWSWKANGQGSSNTDGSINSIYTSANTTSKCSIVKYTGTGSNATVGHGLGVVPHSIWIKCTSNSGEDWMVYHRSIGATHYLTLNTTAGDSSGGEVIWNDTLPTSSVFTIGTNGKVNGSSRTYVAYVFAEVSGFSKINRYFGNGNANGTFVYTGFKPAWILIKKADGAGDNWFIFDSKRAGYNVENYYLHPDTAGVEGTTDYLDIVANGFKLRTSGSDLNGNGNGYTYWSFAEAPLVGTNDVPATSR